MADDGEVEELSAEEKLLQKHRRERKEFIGFQQPMLKMNQDAPTTLQVHKSQANPLDITKVCGSSVQRIVMSLADSIGCPPEFIYFPLLTCCASCMGSRASIEVTPEWTEPPICWSVISANRSSRKTSVVQKFQHLMLDIEKELQLDSESKVETSSSESKPQFLIDQFTMEGLHSMMVKNNSQAIGIYEDFNVFLDSFSDPRSERVMHSLYDGSPWIINSLKYSGTLSKPCLNVTGFLNFDDIVEIINKNQVLREICLFVIPLERNMSFHDLHCVSQDNKLKKAFEKLYISHHESPKIYKFSSDALQIFTQFYDELLPKKNNLFDEIEKTIISKATNQLVRLSGVIAALEMAFDSDTWDSDVASVSYSTEVSALNVWCAKQIVDYVISQKIRLLKHIKEESYNYISSSSPNPSLHCEPVICNPEPTVMYVQSLAPKQDEAVNSSISISPVQMPSMQLPSSPIHHSSPNISTLRNSQGEPVSPSFPSNSSFSQDYESSNFHASCNPTTNTELDYFLQKYQFKIKKTLEYKAKEISASRAVQLKICPKDPISACSGGQLAKYTTSFAKTFFDKLALLGFGDIEERCNPLTRRGTFIWRKRRYEALNEPQKTLLKQLGVSYAQYNACFEIDNNIQYSERPEIEILPLVTWTNPM